MIEPGTLKLIEANSRRGNADQFAIAVIPSEARQSSDSIKPGCENRGEGAAPTGAASRPMPWSFAA